MSVRDVGDVLDYAYECQPREKLVLVALANYADDQRIAQCRIETLARTANVSRRSIGKLLESLERQRYIRIYHSLGVSNVYRVAALGDRAEQECDKPDRLIITGRQYFWRGRLAAGGER